VRLRVPQFIDIEDKTIGPLTIRQFLYLLAGGGVIAILWFVLGLAAFIICATPVAFLSLALTFYKYNDRPFIYFIASFFAYFSKPRLYTWKKEKK